MGSVPAWCRNVSRQKLLMQTSTVPSSSKQKKWCLAVALSLALLTGRTWSKESDVRLEVARTLSEKGEYDKAVLELRRYLNEHPEATDIYARIGRLRFKQGNFKLASENFKIALTKNPSLSEAREGLALAYEKLGDKAKASEVRQQLTKSVQKPVQATSPASHTTPVPPSEATNFSPALDSLTTSGPAGIYAQKEFLDALRLYREKKSDSALVALRKCLSKAPKHPGAYYLGGVIRYEKGDYAKSVFNFKRSLTYPDRGYNANYYLGRIYQKQDRHNDAIEAFEKYLPLTKSEVGKKQVEGFLKQMGAAPEASHEPVHQPAHVPTHEASTEATHDTTHKEPQIPVHAAAEDTVHQPAHVASHPPSQDSSHSGTETQVKPLLLGGNGAMFFIIPDKSSASGQKLLEAWDACRKEKYEKAENGLKETVMDYGGSDNAEAANLDMASVYLQLGLWENALNRLSDYLRRDSKDSAKYLDAAYYLSALAELGHKNGEKAEKNLLKIKVGGLYAPSQEEIDYRLALAGELLKDNKKWAAYLEKASSSAKSAPRKAELTQKLGFLHSQFGSTDRAIEFFRSSIQDCPDSAMGAGTVSDKPGIPSALCSESRLRLADLAFKKKDWKAALAAYKQFAQFYPDHKESAWVHYQIANIYKVTNNFESALNEYKRVIDNYPDSYWASQAKWKREDTIWQKEYEEVLD